MQFIFWTLWFVGLTLAGNKNDPTFSFTRSPATGALERVSIQQPDFNSSVEMLTYGAHVLSFVAGGKEQLYVSPLSPLNGSRPIRGGIPLVFPVFARPKPNNTGPDPYPGLPMHGFARSLNWTLKKTKLDFPLSGDATVVLSLRSEDLPANFSKAFPLPFEAQYSVTLRSSKKGASLKSSFTVNNLSPDKELVYDILFHNYLAIPSLKTISVGGLFGHKFLDKTDNLTRKTETTQTHVFKNATDSVFLAKKKSSSRSRLPTMPHTIALLRSSVNGTKPTNLAIKLKNFRNVVLWNPAQKKTDDLPAGDSDKFVCVEPGTLGVLLPEAGPPVSLRPWQVWTVSQTLQVVL